jgi:hypothetical protein
LLHFPISGKIPIFPKAELSNQIPILRHGPP